MRRSQASPHSRTTSRAESELVLGLAIGNLVDTEPLIGGTEKTGQVSLNILNVVQLGSERVVDVNDNDLPVSLLLVEESHDTEDLDLLDLANVTNKLTDLADIERVVVTLGLGLGVNSVGVLPGLIIKLDACARRSRFNKTYLKLSIGPSRNLDNHVQDVLLLVGVERNIVEGGDGLAILLDVNTVLEGVGSRNLADGVVGGHVGLLL
ncbi:hypothetical protein HG530_004829 [Fusarium avenaceum]|nr:hypothetical protein HG530_004829 [Fusarium avenaceum]